MEPLTFPELLDRLAAANAAADAYIAASPTWVRVWVGWMMLILTPSFLIAFVRREARWVAASMFYTLVFTPFLIHTAGPSRFWGISHILFWTPTAVAGALAMGRVGTKSWYGRWLAAAIATMWISLAFDVVDVARFVAAG